MVEIPDLLGWATKAAALFQEANDLLAKVNAAVESSKEAREATDMEELRRLLDDANERRQAASAELDAALSRL